MAVYKVPQDVEADDKLLGPFSFRQFIYLIIVALTGGMAWLLSQIFIGLIIIPAPVIILFTALALPLKKDQPMEAYLGAMISFYFIKPRKRLWQPDGIESLVEITAPKTVEPERTKDITGDEAKERLGYLTDIVESRGWSIRGVGVPMDGSTSMNSHMVEEAKNAVDMFDDSDKEAQKFDQLIKERREHTVQELSARMQPGGQMQQYQQTPPIYNQAPNTASTPQNQPTPPINPQVEFNPYPQNIRQSVIQPLSNEHTNHVLPQPTQPPSNQEAASPQDEYQSTSATPPSPDIIKLAKESDGLTVTDVARQAQRITNKERGLPEEEVQISLH
ncbi:hypothetical protein GX865_04170 [Candidatus Saccharibacteria bacterium]|jgi:hypothetical protein|nr:hypothetical protein [Candidatus Saccharibacteria bacterium]